MNATEVRVSDGVELCNKLGKSAEALAKTVAIGGSLAPTAALYGALANARAADKRTVAVLGDPALDGPLRALGFHPLPSPEGAPYYGGVIEEVIHRTYEALPGADRDSVRETFPAQIEARLARHVKEFYAGPWVAAVKGRRLSLLQYLVTLENMHQYVRFTTRLLGRAVACSPSTKLRSHFARHLSGEVNHEILIERDLERLGRQTAYLREERYANPETRAFMVLEQSLVSFECDPVLFAACPLAAEGITAHMDRAFLADLRACVAKEKPEVAEKATVFFAAHIESDGGDDGHWASTMKLLHEHLPSEQKLGEMLTILELAARSFTLAFDANVTDYGLFGGTP